MALLILHDDCEIITIIAIPPLPTMVADIELMVADIELMVDMELMVDVEFTVDNIMVIYYSKKGQEHWPDYMVC